MERAVFFRKCMNRAAAKKACAQYDRLYVGDECCFRNMPAISEIEELALMGMPMTIVTPLIFQEELTAARQYLNELNNLWPDAELVFNDWGVLQIIQQDAYGFVRVAGRMISKQVRDPRIETVLGLASEAASRYLRGSVADNVWAIRFLKENMVARIELDNVLQGINEVSGIHVSLHYPEVFVSVSRSCMSGDMKLTAKAACSNECRGDSYRTANREFQRPVFFRGKYQYYLNDQLPWDLASLGVSRLVRNDLR